MPKQIRKSVIFLTVLIFIFSLNGCSGSNTANSVVVTTAVASNQEIELPLNLSGVLVAGQTASISSQISGQVVKLGFNVGSTVKAGEMLIQLDTNALEGQLMAAEAGLQSAQAGSENSKNQSYLAQINLTSAQKNYDRTKQLFDAGAASQLQIEDAQDKLNIATKQYESSSGPALDQAQATIATAMANIKGLNIQIAKSTISSPINGVVTSQNINVGEVVSPAVPVISIIDSSILKLRSTVSQDYLLLLTQGQAVQVSVDGYPNLKLSGKITGIGPMAVNTGEVFPVEISLNNDGNLMAGMSAHAAFMTKVQGIVVPTSAVIQNDGQTTVFVTDGQTASKRVVKTGLKNDNFIQILDGLREGEQVVVSNVGALTDNNRVKVQ